MKKILSIALAVAMVLAMAVVCFAGAVKSGTETYRAWYGWSHMGADTNQEFKFSFYIKGKAGTSVSIDNEAGIEYGKYTIAADDTWEYVEISSKAGSKDNRETGMPIRIYSNWDNAEYFLDNICLVLLGAGEKGADLTVYSTFDENSTTWDYGSWNAGSAGYTADENCTTVNPLSVVKGDNADTADYTAIAAAVACIALAGVAFAAKKH